jgi:hypothetical protein
MSDSPKKIVFDDAVGNLLDNYTNVTYNFKLYMMSQKDLNGGEKVFTTTSATAGEFGYYLPDYKNGNKIILAQTGVTGTSIDNVEIQYAGTGNKATAIAATFTIHQPGTANFIDMIVAAKDKLGLGQGPFTRVILELTFKGYTENEDVTTGGAPVKIGDTYNYNLQITGFNLKIDEAGSKYDFTAVRHSDRAFNDSYFRLKSDFISTGNTISEHLASLQQHINDSLASSVTAYTPDTYFIDTTVLIGDGENQIKTEKIISPVITGEQSANPGVTSPVVQEAGDDNGRPGVNSRGRPQKKVINESTPNNLIVNIPLDSSSTEATDTPHRGIIHSEGDSLRDVLASILRHNEEFLGKATVGITDSYSPSSEGSNPRGNAPTDKEINQAIINFFKVDVLVVDKEWQPLRNQYRQEICYIPRLYKATKGDVQISAQGLKIDSDDISTLNIKKAYYYYFTGINDQILDLNVAFDAGQTLLVPPKTSFTSDILSARNPPGVVSGTNPANPVSSVSSTGTVEYAEDLLATFNPSAVYENSPRASGPVLQQAWIPSSLNNESLNESNNSALLFGYMYARYQSAFMLNVEMTIRGDIWYLETDKKINANRGESNATQIANGGDDNHFYLEITSPRLYDFESDEDKNTGYLPGKNLSNTLSGVYFLYGQYRCKFSGGRFTIDLDKLVRKDQMSLPDVLKPFVVDWEARYQNR